MTQDEQYCVLECTGIYKRKSSSRICTCSKFIAPNGKSCLEECGTGQYAISTSDPDVQQCVCKLLSLSGEECVD